MNLFCYAMCLKGKLRNQSGSQFTAMTRAEDFHVFAGDLVALNGAAFRSTVEVDGDRFHEYGSITFEDGSSLIFEGDGTIEEIDDGNKRGGVVWTITSGEGKLAEATGLITSNFIISPDGDVTDHHAAVVQTK